jgi:crossover junction endodeoxyribonuclease RusA
MTVVAFWVAGLAAPQGSKNPWGGESSKQLRPWRNDVKAAAAKAMGSEPPAFGPIDLVCHFVFQRPKAHFGTGGKAEVLKESAPLFVVKQPDLDKLVRAIGDALTGVVYRDDSQIASLHTTKTYGDRPGVLIHTEDLIEQVHRLVDASGGDVAHAASVLQVVPLRPA